MRSEWPARSSRSPFAGELPVLNAIAKREFMDQGIRLLAEFTQVATGLSCAPKEGSCLRRSTAFEVSEGTLQLRRSLVNRLSWGGLQGAGVESQEDQLAQLLGRGESVQGLDQFRMTVRRHASSSISQMLGEDMLVNEVVGERRDVRSPSCIPAG